MNDPFSPAAVADQTPDFLKPNPPPEIPEAPAAGNATASLSPFSEPQDINTIMRQLVLDRPLKFYIPDREKYPDFEFRIINSIPQEMADARNKGFQPVTDPKFAQLFEDLVAGTDKTGKAFRPILVARPKAVGDEVRRRRLKQLQGLYAGMDPRNRDTLDTSYSSNVREGQDASKGAFSGPGMKIKVY